MIVMSFLTSDSTKWICIAVMALTFGFNGGTMAGHIQNIMGLGPNRSGTLYGITNGFGNLSGFLVPEVTKRVVGTCPACLAEVAGWRWLFLIAAGCFAGFTLYFLLAASPHVQHFNSKDYTGVTTIMYFKQRFCLDRKNDKIEMTPRQLANE